jgi:glyoxylase-like metal-dependent hydrolase (beta-lactamase superfamily II)
VETHEIAPGVFWLPFRIANVYLIGDVGGPWAVVDSGTSGHFEAIRAAAEVRHGKGARPEAVLLTHGHADHYGSALALATHWGVPICAHRMELPYLTGEAKMPPADPTVGGALAFLSRFVPESGRVDLGDSVRPLPADGVVPGMSEWRWLATPGHTPGHVSFFRERDRVLIAGDAVLTVNLDLVRELIRQRPRIARPPAATTYDWISVRKSARRLAELGPKTIAAGHGVPMSGADIPGRLRSFAEDFIQPHHGRYIPEPARFNENGVVYLPPPVPDPSPWVAAALAGGALVGLGLYWGARRRRSEGRRS